MKPTSACTQDRDREAGQIEALYAELEPLSCHRAFVDHLYILRDNGRLTGRHRSVFASPLCEVALVCREDAGSLHRGDEAERWIAVRQRPRFGQRPRQRAFRGWMIGIRCRPSGIVFDEEEIALAALAGVFTGIVREQNPLDDIVHALDGWIEDIVGKSGLRQAEFAGALDDAAASEQSAAMPAADGNPTIAARAAAAGISPRTMLRHVRARTGLAPKRYASLQRFSQALRHLALDHAGFAQIAAEVGYSDQAHMTVDLARHAGLSPGRFRALARRQIRNDAVRFFKDDDLRKRVRLLVCDSGAPIGAAADTGKGQHGQ
ncbi:helix-turn-helix domain-containing protein [Bradyrhizobium sp. S69]|uniref:helix-turn-helix domain-containing protein n=1 Tax=Bradyrhizobium sp. S69 TaxID=1641856 RepID=UPI00131DBF11|nr:helix-turn-helix domain-containing protein [Bradyrhizobium sp. S69]